MQTSPLQRQIKASDVPLDRLANNAQVPEQEKLKAATRAFEAVLLRQILESAQKTVITSELSPESSAKSVYRDLITTQLADSIAKSGEFGLARSFESQWKRLPPEIAKPSAESPPDAADPARKAYPPPHINPRPPRKPQLQEPGIKPNPH